MQTLTIQIQDNSALKAIYKLEEKHAIRIVEDAELPIDSPALPGQPLSLQAFKNWVAAAETSPAVSVTAAKSQWSKQRKQLQKHTR